MSLPPVHIRRGPAGSGKTYSAHERCGPRCWMLVPSEGAVASLERSTGSKKPAVTFRALAQCIVGAETAHEAASPALRAYFLREAVRESVPAGSYFAAAAQRPGFPPAVGDLIREFKQAEIEVADFRRAAAASAPAVDDPHFEAKCSSVADIWEAYDHLLRRHQTFDAEDLLSQAIRDAGNWRARPQALIVDGFTAFTPQQLSLLAALRAAGMALEVCITCDPERPILFARAARTLEEIRTRLQPVTEAAETERARHLQANALRHLERALFAPGTPAPCDDSIRIFEAPDPVMEAEMVAREIHRLIEAGTPPERIAIVQRRLDGVSTLLRGVLARYGIAASFHAGEPLAQNPLVAAVTSLLRIFLQDWPRAEVVRCARSSYFGLPPEEADQLERRAISRGLRGGQSAWLRLIRPEEREELKIVKWMGRLSGWQRRLREPRTPAEMAKLIAQIAGEFGLLARAREGDPLLVEEDQAAWSSALSLLWQVARVSAIASDGPVSFATFAGDVLAGWHSGLFGLKAQLEGHVQVLEAFDARQESFDVLFLMGLNERVFPRTVSDNPFLRDDERQALAAHGVILPRPVEEADEERVLFYRAVTAASRRLVLSYPRTGADGRETLPSYYLDEVRRLFAGDGPPTTARTLADVVPALDEAVGERERLLRAADGFAGRVRMLRKEGLAWREAQGVALEEQLLAHPELAGSLEWLREERPDYRLRSPHVKKQLQDAARRAFSVSELEAFIACPHRHFLGYQLHIRELAEEAGAADLGQLLHAVLRQFFADLREQTGACSPLPEDALARLHAILEALLPKHIRDPRPWRVQMIKHAARETLSRYLERETAHQERSGVAPACFELAFGPQPARAEDMPDPASVDGPLVLPSPGGDVLLCGRIDRLDLTPDGSAAVLLDYKLSHVPKLQEMKNGTSLQVPVYMMAVERLFRKTPVGAVYFPLQKGEPHWFFRPSLAPGVTPGKGDGIPPAVYNELMQTATQAILSAVQRIRAGESAPIRGDACTFCPFQDVCRAEELKAN